MIFQAGITQKGLPAFWETRTDGPIVTIVQLIADQQFKPKKAIFINRHKDIPSENHAIFVAKEGDMIIKIVRNNGNDKLSIDLFLITRIEFAEKRVMLHTDLIKSCDINTINELIEEYDNNFKRFVDAAIGKLDLQDVTSVYSQPMSEK